MSAHPPAAATAPESATTALYRAALGPVNTAHYLAVFERFDEAGRASPVWNPAAGLLTLNWLVFRQLWGSALVYLACAQGLALLVLWAARRFLHWPPSVEWGVLLTLLLLSIAIPGAYGNALLHADTRRRMTRAVREARTVREACAALEKQSSSKRRLAALAVVNLLLAGALASAWLGGGFKRGLPAPAA
ncbi:MAG: sporulation protein, partial [Hydrogenophaga sp.]|nr:sporulation protein [Hydrogenophaga sp.]